MNRCLFISNFERRGLYFSPFTFYKKCLKGRMARPNNGFIFFNKIWFLDYIQMVLGNFILWNIIVFKKIKKQNVFFQLIHFFLPFPFNTIFFKLSKSTLVIFSFISIFCRNKFIIQSNHINFKVLVQNI